MKNYTRNECMVNPFTYDLYVGMDVDKSSISVTVRDRNGSGRSLKMPYAAEGLLSFIENQYPGSLAVFAYEAGPTGFGLYDSIRSAGRDCIVVSPASIPQSPNQRVKTNRLDSVKLAELLRGGQLKGIRVPGNDYRGLRSLVHLRYTYMQDIRAYKCRIKAELLKEGIEFPHAPKGGQWSGKVIASLRIIECSAVIGYKIGSMLDHLDHLKQQLKLTEVAIRSHIAGSKELSDCLDYLMSCPGIGFKIACYVLARLGKPRDFSKSSEAGAFFGLVPREDSTGDVTDRGSITKCGDPRLRSMLVQGAWVAIRVDPELRAFYRRVCDNHSKRVAARVAIVAVARKLSERMHCVLKEQRSYEPRMVA
jgi:transposase